METKENEKTVCKCVQNNMNWCDFCSDGLLYLIIDSTKILSITVCINPKRDSH